MASFDPDQPGPLKIDPNAIPAPVKDAATLLLLRGGREVLMGQRAKGSVFMPNKWVFPGGRVEDEDATAAAVTEFSPETEAWLKVEAEGRAPRAYGLAAARETVEETGLMVGGAQGPSLADFQFIARAITPPGPPRRFDARFFLADAEQVLASFEPISGDELLQVRWFSLEEAFALQDLPRVTKAILKEADLRLKGERPAPAFMRMVDGKRAAGRLGDAPFGPEADEY